ncbi:MAG: large extracellular alpha-helical protein [Gammaproteobacteria bacterium]|nr:large extracellular alpha-helical protein [Gammaproteobacteria bacterium]MBU1654873.1 large extracellular alpha-helical protein [Gammaproteobacteria bacterium]MBU1961164.1 large extracellular alpha-helical protein [Gammaproteobacteria bacterium]
MSRIASPLALLALLLLSPHAVAAFDTVGLASTGELRIERITPEGEDVQPSNQVVIEFNRPVVAIGRMERGVDEIPVTITPALACQWRWISTRTLACNLNEKDQMRPSTRYGVLVRPGIMTLDGVTIAETVEHQFITRRPQVEGVDFRIWNSPTLPVLRVYWDQAVSKATVLQHLYLKDGDDKRIPLLVSADKEKRVLPAWLGLPSEKLTLATDQEQQESDEGLQVVNGQEFRRVWIVEPGIELHADQKIALHVEPGLIPAVGNMPSVEDRLIQEFHTFPEFGFVGIRCTDNAGRDVLVKPGEPQKADNYCNPLRAISLEFSSPVARKMIKEHVVIDPPLGGGKAPTKDDPWGDLSEEDDRVTFPHEKNNAYGIWLPYGLKAAQGYNLKIQMPAPSLWDQALALLSQAELNETPLKDKFGRGLKAPISLSFATDHRLPNFLLEYDAAVLEQGVDSEVPLYVNNLDRFSWTFNRLTIDGAAKALRQETALPKVVDIQFAVPAGVRDMLEQKSGALWGHLESAPKIPDRYLNRDIFAQVTPFQVHLKLGHFNTLAWVTDMATGQPVADAEVLIYQDKLTELNGPAGNEPKVRTDSSGLAILPGTESIDPRLEISQAWEVSSPRLVVRVSKGQDMALLPIWYSFQIDSYRSSGTSFYPSNERKFGHMLAWGTTAQGIYHPGDTIQYKLYVRNQDNQTLVPAPRSGYWLEVVDPTGKVVKKVRGVSLSEFGALEGEFSIGKKAAVGWYDFNLKANFTQPSQEEDACPEGEGGEPQECATQAEFSWTPMRVLVSDFTPAPFKVDNQLSGDLFHPGDTVEVETRASLHSGGPYTQAQARVTAMLTPTAFSSKHPAAAGFTFGVALESSEAQQLYQVTAALDEKGELKTRFPIEAKGIFHGRLMVESAVQDDRGKSVAHQAQAEYVGVDRLAGLRLSEWFYQAKSDIDAEYLAVDDRGAPVPGVAVTLTLERKDRTGARVKSGGNAYVPSSEVTIVKESECQGVSDATAKTCKLRAEKAGDYSLKATLTDTQGRVQVTETQLWVSGSDYVMWDEGSDAHLDVVPDKEGYHIGDTAKFLVKNPYPGAQALVTVERFGVIDRFVMPLKESAAVIELPIKPDYMPGFYLSVVVTSPRVEKPLVPVGQVDLGKPSFRMGYVQVPVKDAYKDIEVKASTDKESYRPGDRVHVALQAQARHPKGEPVELAVVVLDEAVFDLIAQGKAYYDPYGGFYHLDDLDLRNYSLLTRLIGRQKFEKKGANPGGDGGASLDMRSVFKFVSYWNPSLRTDAEGKADIDFVVPDNLTGWRILVLATTPSDRFGLGQGGFKVNRPTEVRPEMPNQVSEGDQFEARFSVMNRTQQPRTLSVSLKAEGDVDGALPAQIEKTLSLKPYERGLVALPVKAKTLKESREAERGGIRFTAVAGDDSDRDGMTHDLPVNKLRSLDVAANYGTTLAAKVSETIAFPKDIFPDVGALSLSLSPSVIGNLEGAFRYMRNYPYACWEQLLTRGTMAAHFKGLNPYISERLKWPGHEGLPEQTLSQAAEFQAPNGGMAYFIATDDRADPYLSAYTALAFNWLKREGHAVPEAVETKLHDYLLNFLRRDEAPSFYTKGMASTVRAVALVALAENKKVDFADLERYAPHVKEMSLFGKTHFAQAALRIDGGETLALDTAKTILSQGNETGGKFVFNETIDDSYSRILHSPLRENCAILGLFTALGETGFGRNLAADLPFKLVRTITQTRGGRDHWENTQENMFCMNALVDYSSVYETEKPSMRVIASLDQTKFGEAAFQAFRDPQVSLERPIEAADVGRTAHMEIDREGTGRLYYATRLSYASRTGAAGDTNAGIEIHREYSMQRNGKWELLPKPYAIRQGDRVRVDLYVSVPAARNFVVVDDPIPGGFEPLNTDLATTSTVDADKGAFQAAGGSLWFKYGDWSEYSFSFWSFYHKELLHHAARFYADYLPPGNYHLSYMAQAIGAGDFTVMPTLAAEMYDPDVYGKTTFEQLRVESNLGVGK